MQTLHSISEILKVIKTNGSNPFVVTCSDLNDYLCKYSRNAPDNRLINEFLANHFCKLWNIPTPEAAIIQVDKEHLPQRFWTNRLSLSQIEKPCIGFLYNDYAKEFDVSFLSMLSDRIDRKKILNLEILFTIAYFDIWMCNEDRNQNNFNLLLFPEIDGNKIVAIDHGTCFNSGNLKLGLNTLTETDSLIFSDPFKKLVSVRSNELKTIAEDVISKGYLCIENCLTSVDAVIDLMPAEWQIDKIYYKSLIKKNLFSKEWLKTTEDTFRNYLMQFKHKKEFN